MIYNGEILRMIESEKREREIKRVKNNIHKMNDEELNDFYKMVKEDKEREDKRIWE